MQSDLGMEKPALTLVLETISFILEQVCNGGFPNHSKSAFLSYLVNQHVAVLELECRTSATLNWSFNKLP